SAVLRRTTAGESGAALPDHCREDAQAHAAGKIVAQKEGHAPPAERNGRRSGRCSLESGHKKDLHDLVRTAALTATRSFHYKTVRCISIKAGDARQGGGTHLLVTDPGEPGSRTGGDACRLIKGTAKLRNTSVRKIRSQRTRPVRRSINLSVPGTVWRTNSVKGYSAGTSRSMMK